MNPLKVALICGKFSTGLHGSIDAERLFEARALTGSESSFFNLARGLSELGHTVHVFCDVVKPLEHCERLAGAAVRHIDNDPGDKYDAYVSLNEPDQFRRLPNDVRGLRIVQQQLNDFPYCMEGFDNYVDIYAFLAPAHRDYVLSVTPQIAKKKAWWIPNSINPEISAKFAGLPKVKNSMAWCSSPDRGLHRLLEMWPYIRKEIPDATLKIFYRFQPWYDSFANDHSPLGARARYIGECLDRLGRNGENGVTLVGAVPNVKLAEELARTEILPYTCDCVRFTEGFSVSIMDACAAGAVPVITDTDAIGDIYRGVAVVLPENPGDHIEAWVKELAKISRDDEYRRVLVNRGRKFAERFERMRVAKLWEIMMASNQGHKENPVFTEMPQSVSDYAAPVGQPVSGDQSKFDPIVRTEAPQEPERIPAPENTAPPSTPPAASQARSAPVAHASQKSARISRGPRVSIVMPAYRPGGMDITFEGLSKQTEKDFELIVVDSRYERRQRKMQELADHYGIPLIHAPEHRRNGKWIVFCAAMNTGFALARGEFVIMLHDFTWVPPNWIEKHLQAHEGSFRRYITADNLHVDLPEVLFKRPYTPPDMEEANRSKTTLDELFHGGIVDEVAFFKDGLFQSEWVPNLPIGPQQWQSGLTEQFQKGAKPDWAWPHLSNDSIRRDLILELNGFDERYDFSRSIADQNFAMRAQMAGIEIGFTDNRVTMPNPRFLARTLPYGADKERVEGRWNTQDGIDYNNIVAETGATFADNPFILHNLTVELEPWRNHDATRVPRDIPDIAYWRRPMTPETPPMTENIGK